MKRTALINTYWKTIASFSKKEAIILFISIKMGQGYLPFHAILK